MFSTRNSWFCSVVSVASMALLAGACGGKQCPTAAPAAAGAAAQPAAAATDGPGRIDAEMAKVAHQATGVYKLKLRIAPDGSLVKLAVYHRDASKVPEGLVRVVEERFPGAEINSYENEHYADAGAVHEVEFTTADGRKCELSRTAAGSDRYLECQIAADGLPPAVTASLQAVAPGSEIVEVETKEWAEGGMRYHVEARVGDALHYLVFDPEGKLVEHYLRVPAAVDLEITVDR